MEGKSENKNKRKMFEDHGSVHITIHDAYVNMVDVLTVDTETPIELTTGSYQENYSVTIPADFPFSTGSSPTLQTKTTKNILSKA